MASSTGRNSAAVARALKGSRSLSTLSDRSVEKEIFRGISRFEAVLGVRQRSVRLADLSGMNMLGVTYINSMTGSSTGILLNEKFFDRKKKDVVADIKTGQYDRGYKNRTNAPLQHTITHELAHATWNAGMKRSAAIAAGMEITALYNKWLKDTKKKGYGTYGRTDVSEFYAEGITKAIHGNADKYTRKLIHITKKYGL